MKKWIKVIIALIVLFPPTLPLAVSLGFYGFIDIVGFPKNQIIATPFLLCGVIYLHFVFSIYEDFKGEKE